jgi:hypothetical protein
MRRPWLLFGSIAGICALGICAAETQSLSFAQRENDAEVEIIAIQRQASRGKLSQILLALANYQGKHKHFPAAAHPNPNLPPEKRISWFGAILPFMEQKAVYDRIAFDKSWDDKANHAAIATMVEGFLNPGLEKPKATDLPPTHYVGLAGLGADGPTLPVESPRAGCFAYDRATRLEDIKDGTTNTAMVCEASKDYGSWAAGGRPTLRSITKEPVINGPDGIGGPWKKAVIIGFADGSVRDVSEKINPKIFKAMLTINGHENIDVR